MQNIGDLGLSGDDNTDEEHAEHMISLALDMLEETKDTNYKSSPYRKICVRIAVNTGWIYTVYVCISIYKFNRVT